MNLALIGGDVICEGFSPLYIWILDRMVPILLKVKMLFHCLNGLDGQGSLESIWHALAILFMVGHILNLLAKPFFFFFAGAGVGGWEWGRAGVDHVA